MSVRISLMPKASALLVMDFQITIVEGYAADKEALLARTARLIEAARSACVMVIYVVVGFRPGYPEISSRNLTFGAVGAAVRFAPGDAATAIHPAVAPKTGDVVVTKHRVGAFAGTDLAMILRANAIDTLLLAGIATSGVILSTVRHAADADYRLLVIGDCCSDQDEEVHRVLVGKVFARQAVLVTAGEIIEALRSRP
jgi:nicotinamidase-related amidase